MMNLPSARAAERRDARAGLRATAVPAPRPCASASRRRVGRARDRFGAAPSAGRPR